MAWIVPVLKFAGRVLVDLVAWKGAESAYNGIKNSVSQGVENAVSQHINQSLNTEAGKKYVEISTPLFDKTDDAQILVNNMRGAYLNGVPEVAQYQAILNDGKQSRIDAAPYLVSMARDEDPFNEFSLSDLLEVYMASEFGDKLPEGATYEALAHTAANDFEQSMSPDALAALRRRLCLYILTDSNE